jgi:anti-sigma regulatory factor (Ser/Thr protein kinase)
MARPVAVPPDSDMHEGGQQRHEAFVYHEPDEYVSFLCDFVREGMEAGEQVLVALPGERLAVLRAALPEAEGLVHYADVSGAGDGPTRTLRYWREFLEGADGAPCRGVVEPDQAADHGDGLDGRLRHERMLGLAFDLHPLRLLCPYDASALAATVVDHARASHTWVYEFGRSGPGATSRAGGPPDGTPAEHGTAAVDPAPEFRFGRNGLARLRRFVEDQAGGAGIGPDRTADLVLAANEIATNIVTHGGSGGIARCWTDDGTFVCELAGPGTIGDPMAGKVRPAPNRPNGRGLWLANQLCDLVELTDTGEGTVTRLHVRNAAT